MYIHVPFCSPRFHLLIHSAFKCRAFSNKDPLEEFRIEAAAAFGQLLARFRSEAVASLLCGPRLVKLDYPPPSPSQLPSPSLQQPQHLPDPAGLPVGQ